MKAPSGSLEQVVENNDAVPAEGKSKLAEDAGTVKVKLFSCPNCATLLLPGAESLTSDNEPRWSVKGRGCPDWPFQFQILQLHKVSRQIDPQALLAWFATFVGDFFIAARGKAKFSSLMF